MDLFEYMRENTMEKESPLAARMRPTTLSEIVGQKHILGEDKLLYRAIKADKLSSIIFYGPPGTGKTTIAKVIANTTSAEFTQINATVAGKKDFYDDNTQTLKVATKFVNVAKKYYSGKCRDIDIIKLNGSIEIAPILGLSDVIVDIVETGTTLKENNLEVKEEIFPISARLIANKSSFKFKTEEIEKIAEFLAEQVKDND